MKPRHIIALFFVGVLAGMACQLMQWLTARRGATA